MIIEVLAKITEIFGQATDLAEYAVVLNHFLDPEADILISHDDSVIGYLESEGFQRADQVDSLLKIRSQIYKPGFSGHLKYCAHTDIWQKLSKDYSSLIESLRLKGLRVSHWETRWNTENGARHLAEHIWIKQRQRNIFSERVDQPSFLDRIRDLQVVDQVVVHEVYSALVRHFSELYRQTSVGDLQWVENELVDGVHRRREVVKWMLFDPTRATKYIEWIRDLSTIGIQRQPQDLRDIADLCFLIEHDLLGILEAIAPLCDDSSPPMASVVEEVLKIWLSTAIGRWYSTQVHELTDSLLLRERVHRWQLDAMSRRLLDLFLFLGMVSTERSGTFVINDIHSHVSDNIARLKRHQTSEGNWIDLYYAVKLESLWSLYCDEELSLRAYDDFQLAEAWRANHMELRQLFQETHWPILVALHEQYGLSDRFEATLESLSTECLASIRWVLGLPQGETTPRTGEASFETQLADFYGARFRVGLERKSRQVAESASFSRAEFEHLFISPFREKAVFDVFTRRYVSRPMEEQVERAFSDYDMQLAKALAWMYPDGIPLPKITDVFPAVLASVGLDVKARNIPYSNQAKELAIQFGGPCRGAVIFIFDAFGLTYLRRLLAHLARENRQDYETISTILAEANQVPASTVFPTQTGPSHVSFITGCYPLEHLIFENSLGPGQNVLKCGVSVSGSSNEKLYFLDKLQGALEVKIISPYKWASNRLPSFLTHPLDVSDWDDPNVPLAQKVYIQYDRRDESEPYETVLALVKESTLANVPFVFVVLVGDVDSLEEHQPEELPDAFLLSYFGNKYMAFLEMVKLITELGKQVLVVQTADHGITAVDPAKSVSPGGFSKEHFYSRERYVEILPNAPVDKVSEFKQQWQDHILDVLDRTTIHQLRWRRMDLPNELVLYRPHVTTPLGRQKLKGHGGISVDEMIIPLIWWGHRDDRLPER
jgi:hypothetical protein